MGLPAAWHEAGTHLPHQNKDRNSSSTPRLPRDDKPNCAISSKPSRNESGFQEILPFINQRFVKKNPNPPKNHTTEKKPQRNQKAKKSTKPLHSADWWFCQTATVPMSQGTIFPHLAQDQMHGSTPREQGLLYSAFAKDITGVSAEKMLSETKAVLHINTIDLQN